MSDISLASQSAAEMATSPRQRSVSGPARTSLGSFGGSCCNHFLRPVAHLTDCIGELFHCRDASHDCFGQTLPAVLEIATGDLALLVDCEGVAVRERHLYQLSTPARLVWQLKLRRQGFRHRQDLFDIAGNGLPACFDGDLLPLLDVKQVALRDI